MPPQLVAIRADTQRALLATIDAVWDRGDVPLPLAVDAPDAFVTDLLARLRPAGFTRPHLDPTYGMKVHHLPRAATLPDDARLVVTTSGSTGRPKGVVLSRAALAASVSASVDRLGCAAGTPWLVCLPLHHVAGITAVLRARHLDAEPVLLDGFEIAAVDAAIGAHPGAWVSLVPTQLRRLLDARVDVARLGGLLLGGAGAPAALLAEAEAAGLRVVRSYGMTETCGGCVYDGRPLDGVQVAVDERGHVAVAGPVVASGYLDDGAVTPVAEPDGRFVTRDLATLTDGVLEVLGRADDVIVSGGENVPAGRVAEALRDHAAVADAVVVGRPDAEWGHVAVAVIEVATGAAEPTLAALRDHVAVSLPRAWAPHHLRVVEAIPRTGLGKPDRTALDAIAATPDDPAV